MVTDYHAKAHPLKASSSCDNGQRITPQLENLDLWHDGPKHGRLEDHTWDGRTNDRGVAIIRFCEGWPKGGKPYECPAGYWKTGYGSLKGLNGKPVNKNSRALTKKQGEELLRRDLAKTARAVHWLVGPKLTSNQFLATVRLEFNISSNHFRVSQIRQRLLRDDHDGAADIWWQWQRGGPDRRILSRLLKSREMERELFETA